MKKIITLLPLVFLLTLQRAHCQHSFSAGVELDVLPYITGGYFAAGWAGVDHVRMRALVAKVNMPEFIVPKGFTNNTIHSYALLGDYFLKKDFTGFWLAAGVVLWQGRIQTDEQIETTSYNSFLLNGSLGYVYSFNKWLYIGPWAGLSLRVGGDNDILVDGVQYEPPFINPELSLKVGIRF